MSERRDFEDSASPCSCPRLVVEHLALAVRYAEAAGLSEEALRGANYVKTFVEQPSEVWCQYIALAEGEGEDGTA